VSLLRRALDEIISQIKVLDENGENMLFTLFNIENDSIRIN